MIMPAPSREMAEIPPTLTQKIANVVVTSSAVIGGIGAIGLIVDKTLFSSNTPSRLEKASWVFTSIAGVGFLLGSRFL